METSAAPPRRRTKTKSPQHRGRVLALQVLYEVDVTTHEWEPSMESHAEATAATPRVAAFAEAIVRGVVEALARIDGLIRENAPMFPVDQLSPVDRNVLRLAIFELLPPSVVPPKVVINEAVELAKEFGGEASARFVNGVLGSAFEQLAATGPTTTD